MSVLKKNSQHSINITDVDANGFGVGRIDGLAVFVEGALPGDALRVRILKTKPRYAYAKTERILAPSPHRKKDLSHACPAAAHCGGCQWQHCEYEAQLQFKKRIVFDALERIGKIPTPPVADVMGMENPYHYRNKAVFPVGAGSATPFIPAIGVYAPRSHRIIPVTHCNIQHPIHEPILEAVRIYMKRFRVPAYDETTHTGLMRQVMVRTGNHANEVMAVCVINGKNLPNETELTRLLTQAGVTTSLINPHTKTGNAVLGERFRVLSGEGTIHQRIGRLEYRLSARSFFQVNTKQTEVLYETAMSLPGFQLNEDDTIIDAHAGVGGIALYAAKRVKQVFGVDIIPQAVADARANAVINGVHNVEFICGAAEEIIPDMLTKQAADTIFLDPPRKGCGAELLSAIVSAKIKNVIYISCEPATLARDIQVLMGAGYMLMHVQPVDMFPQTGKVECVAGLCLKNC